MTSDERKNNHYPEGTIVNFTGNFSFSEDKNKKPVKYPDIPAVLSLGVIIFLGLLYVPGHYSYYSGDQNEQIPVILRMTDPHYLASDWFVNQNEGFSVRYYYSSFIAFFSHAVPLPEFFYLVYLILFFLTLFAVYLISKTLFDNNIIPVFTVFLIVSGPQSSLGATWMISSQLIPASFTIPLMLFSIFLFLKKRYWPAFIILGISAYFQFLYAVLLAVLLLTIVLIDGFNQKKFKDFLIAAALFGIIAIPGILPAMVSSRNLSDRYIAETILIRHPWHYLPGSFPLQSYLIFFTIIFLFLLVIYLGFVPEKQVHGTILRIVAMTAVFCIIGTIFVELFPEPFIIKLQLFRISWLIVLFAYMYIGFFCVHLMTYGAGKKILRNIPGKPDGVPSLFFPIFILMMIVVTGYFLLQVDYGPVESDNAGLYRWIKTNTPETAIFIIPPQIEDFRLQADRAVVADFKAFPFKDSSIPGWRMRINDLTNGNFSLPMTTEKLESGYLSLNQDDIIRIKNTYSATYYLSTAEDTKDFRIAYRDENYILYDLS